MSGSLLHRAIQAVTKGFASNGSAAVLENFELCWHSSVYADKSAMVGVSPTRNRRPSCNQWLSRILIVLAAIPGVVDCAEAHVQIATHFCRSVDPCRVFEW